MKTRLLIVLISLVLAVFFTMNVHVSYAAPRTAAYEIGWWTVDGGGGQTLTGGSYTLKGTVGQPDAGVQTGIGYTLGGGFWILDVFGYKLDLPIITR